MSEPQGTERREGAEGTEDTEGTTKRLTVLEKTSAAAGDHEPPPPLDDTENEAGRTGRFWSSRRIPAGIVALLLFVVAGAFLYDIASVRADRPAMRWRRELARQLAERPLDDIWVLVGAGVAAAVGLWLILLATTPGLRAVLPMRRTHPDVRAGLHRDAAAMVLRDRAMEVAGVQSVRVRTGRRKAQVRAVSHFRELDDVHGDLDSVLTEAIRALGLSRPLALTVHVARTGRKG
ncbi:hypothetical protein GR925_06805 [Streptomyces sp. HUCO-GS316]|uniref:DUF6286 domain-containing protein n=1 Tax=Streptomyces sp. HUCO-GS316 TaxID=2692198 RepID=UPI00136AB70C|nr:DUF6286 domain-containing protein [Streptomyces sp. HUCO-GS316]MXM63167.1 hypothetical protein [Streptomyces sp. HUCO-GS316]